jgi:hypothetical protein
METRPQTQEETLQVCLEHLSVDWTLL